MKAGCYSLDLYCDSKVCIGRGWDTYGNEYHRAQYTGETFAECKRKAKADGWTVGNWTAKAKEYCPACSGYPADRPTYARPDSGGE